MNEHNALLQLGTETGQPPAQDSLLMRLKGPLIVVSIMAFFFLAGLGLWAGFVPIAGGAIASGIVGPEGSKKTVQHLEGGIVEKILVRDGHKVREGDPLLILAPTQAKASLAVQEDQLRTQEATLARLRAELLEADEIIFPPWSHKAFIDPDVQELIRIQLWLFNTNREAMLSREEIQRQQIAQLKEEIAGLTEQVAMQAEELSLIGEQLKTAEGLLRKGVGTKPRVMTLKREHAELAGERAANVAAIGRAQKSIEEIKLQITTAKVEHRAEIARQVNETMAEIARIREQSGASQDVLDRTVIVAPVSGTIVNSRFKTLGGVVKAGDPVLDIVPAHDDLVINARVSPIDIDIVHEGLGAQVTLTAFEQRNLPIISGQVKSVSADSMDDGDGLGPYYKAVVRIDGAVLRSIAERTRMDLELKAGMPADVLIVTGHRTFLSYLTDPITSSFRKSFREG